MGVCCYTPALAEPAVNVIITNTTAPAQPMMAVAAQPMMAVAVAAPQPQQVQVTCPAGVMPGGVIEVNLNGQMMQVQVPPGVQPGQVR